MDTVAIRASARRILELANNLPVNQRRDFQVEAAAILQLTEPPKDLWPYIWPSANDE